MSKLNIPLDLPKGNLNENPDSDHIKLYGKEDERIYKKDSAGNEHQMLGRDDLEEILDVNSHNPITNAAISEVFRITREPTGFYSQTDHYNQIPTVSYDSVTKRATITGTVKGYYRGRLILDLNNESWVSDPCPNVVGERQYMLVYNGSGWEWKLYGNFTFSDLMVIYVYFRVNGDFVFGLRELHGFMPWESHAKWHANMGTTLISGGDLSSYVLNSTTALDRRPDVSQTLVEDEDLRTFNTQLTSKLYTQAYLNGTTATSLINQTDIVPLSGNQPLLNSYNDIADTWSLTPMTNNRFMSVWVYAKPSTADAQSQNYRYVFLTGQSESTSIEEEELKTVNDLKFADLLTIIPEVVFIGQIIIEYTAVNWRIAKVNKLTGSRVFQVSQPATPGMTTVYSDASINGTGTIADPLYTQKELIPGIKITDSPEFADVQVTELDSVTNGGIISDNKFAWLNAISKSIRSITSSIIDKLFALESVALVHNNSTLPDASLFKPGDEWQDPVTLDLFKVYYSNGTNMWVQVDGIYSNSENQVIDDFSIPDLAVDTNYDATTLALLNEIFSGTIPDSVKQHLSKIWREVANKDNKIDFGRLIETETATLQAADVFKYISGNYPTQQTFTIPTGTFVKGDWINIQQKGFGQIKIEVADGLTQFINNEVYSIRQYDFIQVVCEDDTVGAEVFKVIGGVL
jgi:hypothetical protein